LIGPQIRKWRDNNGSDISRDSLASLEFQRRRVPDCEVLFLSRALNVSLLGLFPKNVPLHKIGPQFQAGQKLTLFPTRTEK
jgi:hypothetical protein